MRGDEERVVAAYASWVERKGGAISREVNFADVYAERGREKLYAEAKGQTAAIGLDVESWYRLSRLVRPCAFPPGCASSCMSTSSKLTTWANCVRVAKGSVHSFET
jgi:hypothetical protein